MRRTLAFLAAGALAVAACSYESSGTTSTTVADPADVPPPTGPAGLVFEDQLVEGSAVTVASVTLPAGGFVVLHTDRQGTAGEVMGVSELLGAGMIAEVPVPLYLPLEGQTVVHATLHIDMDRNGAFRYEPPDEFIDLPATLPGGGVATASAVVGLLAPLIPADVAIDDQRGDGASVVVASVTLPAGGFVAIQADQDGVPGAVLGLSGLLPAGTSTVVEVALDRPLDGARLVFAVAYVDRDGNGIADLGEAEPVDQVARRLDGQPARAAAQITVVLRSPAALEVDDQEGAGDRVVVASVTLPSDGFIEVRADEAGAAGRLLGVSRLLPAGTATGVEVALDEALATDTTVWVRLRVDFDGDGELGPGDPFALTEGGRRAQGTLAYTLAEED